GGHAAQPFLPTLENAGGAIGTAIARANGQRQLVKSMAERGAINAEGVHELIAAQRQLLDHYVRGAEAVVSEAKKNPDVLVRAGGSKEDLNSSGLRAMSDGLAKAQLALLLRPLGAGTMALNENNLGALQQLAAEGRIKLGQAGIDPITGKP